MIPQAASGIGSQGNQLLVIYCVLCSPSGYKIKYEMMCAFFLCTHAIIYIYIYVYMHRHTHIYIIIHLRVDVAIIIKQNPSPQTRSSAVAFGTPRAGFSSRSTRCLGPGALDGDLSNGVDDIWTIYI